MSDGSRIALVTGAAGGLGRATVSRLLLDGWKVIAASHQAADWPTEDGLTKEVVDVCDDKAVTECVAKIITEHGHLDALINNAGVANDAPVWQVDDEQWDAVLDVNLSGAFRCARAVARIMAKQRRGHIVNISSYAGRAGSRGQSSYAAAKAGLLGLTQSLAKELGSRNVRVNAVLPGVLPTKMTAALSAEQLATFAAANALGRINSLEEVARFIAFLLSTENISGQVFQLDSRIAPWT
jgi:3-oxoacyl-[acyl-carrier protein] reductase